MNTQLHRTILIVEDSSEDRELYRRYLLRDRDYNYTIIEASLGEEGLNLWRQHQPDAVLLDYRLPDLDGLEFLAALQPQQPLPIVMMTGAGNEAIAVQAIKAGAQDYLVKGQITPEGLKLALDATIKTVQLQTQLQERIDRERVITQISQKVSRSLDLDEILHTTVTEVRQFLQTDRVVVFQVEPDGNGRVIAESVGAEWRSILSEQIYDPCFIESYVQIYQQGRATANAAIHDGSVARCHVELLSQYQVQANLVVPILHDAQFWGVLIAHSCAAPRQWRSLEIDLLQQLSTQVSVAIRQAELYQQAQAELAERKRTEEVLRSSEERLRLGLQAARMGTWDWDIAENRIIWSANMEAMFGLASGEFDGSYDQFVARLHPDDRDRVLDAIDAAMTPGANYDIEFRVLYPDGTIRWALSQGKVFYDASGQAMRMLGVDLDITGRKQVEEALRLKSQEAEKGKQILDALMEYIPEGITIADAPDVAIRQVSKHGQRLVGQSLDAIANIPAEEHAEKWNIFYADGITPAAEEDLPLTRAVKQGELVTDEEWVLRRPDGPKITILCNAAPIYNADGQITSGVVVWRDISDRVQFERDREHILQQKQAALEESERVNRIKDEFLAILSHELRSPLTPILGWTKLLQTRRFDETKTIAALEKIERNVNVQCQLIDDLLDMASVLRGKLTLNAAPVNLAGVIESAIDTVQTAVIAKSIQIHPVLSEIGQISGDAVRLQQIVWNLLTNAVKFTPNGGRIDIRLEQIDNQAQITITDTGKGISPDFLPHIFESFRQEDSSVTRRYGGLGLGMAIVYQLVEAHGGIVTPASLGEGKGATFTVRLPLLNTNSKENQSHPLRAQNLDLTSIRVLVIDDEPDSRELLAVILAQAGAEVMSVASAAEFLIALESFQPNVVVSDIGMPEIDGYTLLKHVRSLSPEQGGQVPAIALSAYAGEIDRQQAIAAGFQKHITKPIEPDRLVVAIVSLLDHKNGTSP